MKTQQKTSYINKKILEAAVVTIPPDPPLQFHRTLLNFKKILQSFACDRSLIASDGQVGILQVEGDLVVELLPQYLHLGLFLTNISNSFDDGLVNLFRLCHIFCYFKLLLRNCINQYAKTIRTQFCRSDEPFCTWTCLSWPISDWPNLAPTYLWAPPWDFSGSLPFDSLLRICQGRDIHCLFSLEYQLSHWLRMFHLTHWPVSSWFFSPKVWKGHQVGSSLSFCFRYVLLQHPWEHPK